MCACSKPLPTRWASLLKAPVSLTKPSDCWKRPRNGTRNWQSSTPFRRDWLPGWTFRASTIWLETRYVGFSMLRTYWFSPMTVKPVYFRSVMGCRKFTPMISQRYRIKDSLNISTKPNKHSWSIKTLPKRLPDTGFMIWISMLPGTQTIPMFRKVRRFLCHFS